MANTEGDWSTIAGQPDPRHEKEVPISSLGGWWQMVSDRNFTDTDIEALMSAPPGYDPPERDRSWDDLPAELELTEVEQAVLDAMIYEGLSVRDTARLLGMSPTSVHRMYHSVKKRVERFLEK